MRQDYNLQSKNATSTSIPHLISSLPFFPKKSPFVLGVFAHSPRASPGTTPVAVPWASAVHPDLRPPPRRAADLRPCAA